MLLTYKEIAAQIKIAVQTLIYPPIFLALSVDVSELMEHRRELLG